MTTGAWVGIVISVMAALIVAVAAAAGLRRKRKASGGRETPIKVAKTKPGWAKSAEGQFEMNGENKIAEAGKPMTHEMETLSVTHEVPARTRTVELPAEDRKRQDPNVAILK